MCTISLWISWRVVLVTEHYGFQYIWSYGVIFSPSVFCLFGPLDLVYGPSSSQSCCNINHNCLNSNLLCWNYFSTKLQTIKRFFFLLTLVWCQLGLVNLDCLNTILLWLLRFRFINLSTPKTFEILNVWKFGKIRSVDSLCLNRHYYLPCNSSLNRRLR